MHHVGLDLMAAFVIPPWVPPREPIYGHNLFPLRREERHGVLSEVRFSEP